MKFLFLGLLALSLAVIIGSLVGSDTGYVVMAISGWTIQTSAALFVIILFVGFLLAYFTVRAIIRFSRIPSDLKKWRIYCKQRYAEKYLTEGLINMTEGRWKQAERNFCKAASYSKSPYVNYLFAARAAQELFAIDRRDSYLHLAYQSNPDASLPVGITQAELQLVQHQTEQALATLKHLQREKPEQIQVKQLLLDTYTNLDDWQSVLSLIPSIKKARIYSREQIQAKQLDAYAGLLKEAGRLHDQKKIDLIWKSIPRELQQHFYLIEVYISERLKFDDTQDCELLLRKALKKRWDTVLIRLYGLVKSDNAEKHLQNAESYLRDHAHDSALLLTLGRLCKRNKLWGKAKDYLQESINVQANPEAYYEFAKFHELEGNREEATKYYKKGLTLACGEYRES